MWYWRPWAAHHVPCHCPRSPLLCNPYTTVARTAAPPPPPTTHTSDIGHPPLSQRSRVTDDKDRRLLATVLRRVVAPETVDQPRAELLTRRRRDSDDDGFTAAFGVAFGAAFGAGFGAGAGGGGAAGGQGPLLVVVPDTTTLEG
jgi:hypothetical protein